MENRCDVYLTILPLLFKPLRVRAKAVSISTSSNWVFNFVSIPAFFGVILSALADPPFTLPSSRLLLMPFPPR
jgi:hypothetical protein